MKPILPIILLSLSACQYAAAHEHQGTGLCNAKQWSALIGQPSQSAEQIPNPKRIIPPGTAVTKDYRQDRTNIDLDPAGLITNIWCG